MPHAYLTTSWDDGHPLDLRLAGMLGEHHLRGTFYVPRSAPTGTLAKSQLRELSASFEIGAHTLDHVYLTGVPQGESERQIAQSKIWIEQTTGQGCAMFCPPAGKYARRHLPIIRDAGYLGIRSVQLLSLSPPRPVDGVLVMPTTLQVYPHSRSTYVKNSAKRHAWANLWQYIRAGCPDDLERLTESLLGRTVARGGVFHLWGHSWELQRHDQWDRLRRVLRLMQRFASEAPCLTNGQICRAVNHRAIAPPAQQASPATGFEGGAQNDCRKTFQQ